MNINRVRRVLAEFLFFCEDIVRMRINPMQIQEKKNVISFDDQIQLASCLIGLEPFGKFDNDINFNLGMEMGYPFWAIMMFCM